MAYRADIQIVVNGATQITNLQTRIKALEAGVASLNTSLRSGTVASISNFNKLVGDSDRVMRSAAQGTRVQKQAIDAYVRSVVAAERAESSLQKAIATRRKELGVAPTADKSTGARGGGGRLGGAISGAVIGGSFPLLFGQGGGAAAGGAIGGLAGGLLGPGGSFAGSLLGTLIGDIASKGKQIKELGADIGFSAEQTNKLQEAFKLAGQDADKFTAAVQNIRGLGLSIEDQADAIRLVSQLTETYGGRIDKVTSAFANALESGKVTQATINQLTNEGITVQDALAQKYGVSRDAILQMAKDGKISVQTLADVLVDMGNKGVEAGEKPKSAFDRFTEALGNTASAIGNVANVLLTVLGPAIDGIILKAAAALNALTETINTELLRTKIQNQTGKIISPERLKQIEEDAMGMAARRYPSKAQGRQLAAGTNIISPRAQQEFQILREQGIRNELQRFGYEQGILKVPTNFTAPQIGRIAAPGQLPPSGGGGGGKSVADKAAEAAAREAARVAEVVRNQKFITNELGLQTKFAQLIFEAEQAGEPVRAKQLQTVQELVLAGNETAKLLEEEQNRTAQLAIARARQANAESIRSKGAREVLALQMEQQKNFDEIIATLDFEFQLQQATTEEVREQLRLENELRKLKGEGFTDAQFEEIKKRKQRLAAPKTEGQKVEERIGTLKDDLKELTSISNQVIQAADAIGSAFQQAFMGLVSGSMTGQQALAAFFQGVGDHFMDMASQMIAKLIEIYILETVLGFITGGLGGGFGGGGGGGGDFSGAFGSGGPSFNPGAFSGPSLMAEGGFVTGPTSAIIGEGGESEYVIPASKMSAAMQRYGSGARGSAVIPTSGGSTEPASTGAAPGGAIDVRYTVERINSVDYVTADQFQQGMQQAAAQGAQRGEQRALRSLQQSTSVRSRVGIR